MPEPFTEAELNDTDNAFAQEAKQKLGSRLDPDYIGVTCDGEVGQHVVCDSGGSRGSPDAHTNPHEG